MAMKPTEFSVCYRLSVSGSSSFQISKGFLSLGGELPCEARGEAQICIFSPGHNSSILTVRSAVKFSVTPPSVSESGLYGNAEDF